MKIPYKKNSVTMRTDPELKKLFNEVRIEKIKLGECTNLKEFSDRRLTKEITKIPNIKQVLVGNKIKK